MSAANYHDIMIAAQHPKQSIRKLRLPWWLLVMAWCVAMGFLAETGNWVLIVAAWAAVMIYMIVSYKSFAKRQRSAPTG